MDPKNSIIMRLNCTTHSATFEFPNNCQQQQLTDHIKTCLFHVEMTAKDHFPREVIYNLRLAYNNASRVIQNHITVIKFLSLDKITLNNSHCSQGNKLKFSSPFLFGLAKCPCQYFLVILGQSQHFLGI